MNIRECIDDWETMDDKVKADVGTKLFNILSGVSQQEMRQFQMIFDGSKTFGDFKKAQKEKLEFCLNLEIADIGNTVREALGLELITWETEL